jgi:hypothetical protein
MDDILPFAVECHPYTARIPCIGVRLRLLRANVESALLRSSIPSGCVLVNERCCIANTRVESHLKVSRSHIKLREYVRLLRANPFKRLRNVWNWSIEITAHIVDCAKVDANHLPVVLSAHDCSTAILRFR